MTYFLNNNYNSFLRLLFIYSIPKYSLEFPVLYSRFLLIIYFIYSNVYVSIADS